MTKSIKIIPPEGYEVDKEKSNVYKPRHKDICVGVDCPFDVEMNGLYGTCNCGGENYETCLGDV